MLGERETHRIKQEDVISLFFLPADTQTHIRAEETKEERVCHARREAFPKQSSVKTPQKLRECEF